MTRSNTSHCISKQQPQGLRNPRRMSNKELSQNMSKPVTKEQSRKYTNAQNIQDFNG
jgi:hypothetical protein